MFWITTFEIWIPNRLTWNIGNNLRMAGEKKTKNNVGPVSVTERKFLKRNRSGNKTSYKI